MNRFPRVALLALSTFIIASHGQEPSKPAPAKSKPVNDIFSGSVTELTSDSLTVVRKVPARDAVIRKFALDAQTKVEGKLHLKARVTVRYQTAEDGQLHALHILVRP